MNEVWIHSEIKLLLKLYEQRPMLWSAKHRDYHHKDRRREAVREIAGILNRSEKSVEIKLKSLRTYFSDQLKKQKMEPAYTSRWPYFKNMQFLMESYMARQARITPTTEYHHQLAVDSTSLVTQFKVEPPYGDATPPHGHPHTDANSQSPSIPSTSALRYQDDVASENALRAGPFTPDDAYTSGTDMQDDNRERGTGRHRYPYRQPSANSHRRPANGEGADGDLSDDGGSDQRPFAESSQQHHRRRSHRQSHPRRHDPFQHQCGSQHRGFAEFVEHTLRGIHPRLQAEAFLDLHKLLFEYQTRSSMLDDSAALSDGPPDGAMS